MFVGVANSFFFSLAEVDLQAMDRAHRIGAKKPVQVRMAPVQYERSMTS